MKVQRVWSRLTNEFGWAIIPIGADEMVDVHYRGGKESVSSRSVEWLPEVTDLSSFETEGERCHS